MEKRSGAWRGFLKLLLGGITSDVDYRKKGPVYKLRSQTAQKVTKMMALEKTFEKHNVKTKFKHKRVFVNAYAELE